MEKRNKMIYWIATGLWLLACYQAAWHRSDTQKRWVDLVSPLGLSSLFLYIIGIWKILGVIAILIPGFKLAERMGLCRFLFCYDGRTYFTPGER